MPSDASSTPPDRATEFACLLKLAHHPEGGHYCEIFRAPREAGTTSAPAH